MNQADRLEAAAERMEQTILEFKKASYFLYDALNASVPGMKESIQAMTELERISLAETLVKFVSDCKHP